LQFLPYTGQPGAALWYDNTYGFYFEVNATNTQGVQQFLSPGAPAAITNNSWCGAFL